MPYEEESKNARRRAIRYLVYRDRSRNEIIRYLNGGKFSADAVNETLIFLESNDYINDERFAMQFGRSRIVNKKIGRLRLGLELGNKGLERKIIEETLNSLYEEYDEKKIAMSCAKKKLATYASSNSEKDRRRIAKFLERKGFPSGIIYEVLIQLVPYTPNNDLDPLSRLPNKSPEELGSHTTKIIQG
jgi:regulatory protein